MDAKVRALVDAVPPINLLTMNFIKLFEQYALPHRW